MPKKWNEIVAGSKVTPEQHAENIHKAQEIAAHMKLDELRRARHLSQAQLADTLEIDQTAVSRLERRSDLYISTLRRFIEAAGGELCIIAKFPDSDPIEIDGFEGIEPPTKRGPTKKSPTTATAA